MSEIALYAAYAGAGLCTLLVYTFIAKVMYIKIGGTDEIEACGEGSELCIMAFLWPIILPVLVISIPIKFAWNLKKIPSTIPEAKAKCVDHTRYFP